MRMNINSKNYEVKEDGTRVQKLTVGHNNVSRAEVELAYKPLIRHFEFRKVIFDRDIPRWIEIDGLPPLVEGKGSPLIVVVGISFMKSVGLAAGELKTAKMCSIQDLETVLDLEALCRRFKAEENLPGLEVTPGILSEMIRATETYAHAKAFLVNSGHEITSAEVSGGKRTTVEEFLKREERRGFSLAQNAETAEEIERILGKYEIERSDEIWWDFDINFCLERYES